MPLCKMAEKKKTKIRYVDVNVNRAGFVSKLMGAERPQDFSDIKLLRNLLSNEKARILDAIKNSKPKSIYELAKKLNRGFKSVNDDIKLLERFGLIELVEEKIKGRTRHRPEIIIDTITMQIKI